MKIAYKIIGWLFVAIIVLQIVMGVGSISSMVLCGLVAYYCLYEVKRFPTTCFTKIRMPFWYWLLSVLLTILTGLGVMIVLSVINALMHVNTFVGKPDPLFSQISVSLFWITLYVSIEKYSVWLRGKSEKRKINKPISNIEESVTRTSKVTDSKPPHQFPIHQDKVDVECPISDTNEKLEDNDKIADFEEVAIDSPKIDQTRIATQQTPAVKLEQKSKRHSRSPKYQNLKKWLLIGVSLVAVAIIVGVGINHITDPGYRRTRINNRIERALESGDTNRIKESVSDFWSDFGGGLFCMDKNVVIGILEYSQQDQRDSLFSYLMEDDHKFKHHQYLIEYVAKYGEEGNVYAQEALAYYYLKTCGDMERGYYWALKSAEQDSPRSLRWCGRIFRQEENQEYGLYDLYKSFMFYKKAAELGDKMAALEVGNYYRDGLLVKNPDYNFYFVLSPDIEMAKHWWRIASESNNINVRESAHKALEKIY